MPELKEARKKLHELIDPIWQSGRLWRCLTAREYFNTLKEGASPSSPAEAAGYLSGDKVLMTKRTLQRHGYTVKHTSVGWWVDGACGYMVSGYHPTEALAVAAAGQAIAAAKAAGSRPCWMF